MRFLYGRRENRPPQTVSVGFVILALLLIFSQSFPFLALAQDEGAATEPPPAASPPAEEPPPPSAEAEAAVTNELAASEEVGQELAVNVEALLGLEGYDPIVPTDGFVGEIIYPVKEVVWDAQEGLYSTFASEASYAQLVKSHADKELVAAAEIYADDSEQATTVLGVLGEYQEDVVALEEVMEELKSEDAALAKSLAAEGAEAYIFIAPKVFGTMQNDFLANSPEMVPDFLAVKNDTLASASNLVFAAADSQAQGIEVLNSIASEAQLTAFSGLAQAEILSQARGALPDELAGQIGGALDEVINTQIKAVEENLKNLEASDETKAQGLEKYLAQLPGQSIERLKIVDQFKSQAQLSPVFLEKMQEVKAKVAQTIGANLKNLADEEIRKAVSKAMLDIKATDIQGLKVLTEMQDLIPDEQIKQEIVKKREEQLEKFRSAFSDDAKAQAVSQEFEQLMKKVEAGQIVPDANFFKTLEDLKGQLAPEQQRFVDQLEETGKQEMLDRMQNDEFFAERFATFNPGDLAIYEQMGEGGFDFRAKFQEIEQQQAENFARFLETQSRPEDVAAIREEFEKLVPAEIREKFETQYEFDSQTFEQYQKFAEEKQVFFEQELQEEAEAEFRSQYGDQPPGQMDYHTPPTSEALNCPPEYVATPFGCEPHQGEGYSVTQDPEAYCRSGGGTWTGNTCEFQTVADCPYGKSPDGSCLPPPEPISAPTASDPAAECARAGGIWSNGYCEIPNVSPPPSEPVPVGSPPTSGYAPYPQVAGTWTRVYPPDFFGIFDFLAIFGVGNE